MGIRLTKIELKNFRQYRNNKIEFNDDKKTDLHILIAKNGTGKTTLINSIMWCLYGKEYHLNDGPKSLQILNEASLSEAQFDELLEVIVVLTLKDDDKTIKINRTNQYKVKKNIVGEKIVKLDKDEITATVLFNDEFRNPDIIHGIDAEVLIKQYFDENIFLILFVTGR